MKALVKRAAARGLWLEDVPEPQAGPNDVKICVKRTAICGTERLLRSLKCVRSSNASRFLRGSGFARAGHRFVWGRS